MKLPFQQGIRPCLMLATASDWRGLCQALQEAGYRVHRGPRTTRAGERRAWLREFGRGRQVHVQAARETPGGPTYVFAHTEPAGTGLDHAVSALLGQASYQAGARVLLADLRRVARAGGLRP